MYEYVYIYMCIYINMCTRSHTYTCTLARCSIVDRQQSIHVCVYIYTPVVFLCIHEYIYTQTYTYIHTYTHTYTHTNLHAHTQIPALWQDAVWSTALSCTPLSPAKTPACVQQKRGSETPLVLEVLLFVFAFADTMSIGCKVFATPDSWQCCAQRYLCVFVCVCDCVCVSVCVCVCVCVCVRFS